MSTPGRSEGIPLAAAAAAAAAAASRFFFAVAPVPRLQYARFVRAGSRGPSPLLLILLMGGRTTTTLTATPPLWNSLSYSVLSLLSTTSNPSTTSADPIAEAQKEERQDKYAMRQGEKFEPGESLETNSSDLRAMLQSMAP